MADKVQEYAGAKITVRFEGARCIHSRNCVLGDPRVFVPNAKGAWIQPEATGVEAVAALVRACPSGALTYERNDGGEQEAAPVVNVVRLRENGPLAFHADLEIAGVGWCHRATLCRCGASANKPLCDGKHTAVNFVASGEAVTDEPGEALAKRDGPLVVNPTLDGPLHVQGNLEIVSGTGRTIQRTTEAWLCRCGHSASKPFCDGSHKRVGFKAPGV